MNLSCSIPSLKLWLLAITTSVSLIHLILSWRTVGTSFVAMSLLFWVSAAALVRIQRNSLSLESGFLSSGLGAMLLLSLLVLTRSAMIGDNFLRVYPFWAAVGLALLSSGFKGSQQFSQPLTLLFFLGVPEVCFSYLIDISEVTARLSTVMLWHCGFNAVRQGVNISLSGSSVEVYAGCSGLQLMMQMLGLAVFVLIMLPLRWSWIHKIGLPLVAMLIAFLVNGVRVGLMTVLYTQGQRDAFDYWHLGNGSLLFSGVAALLFILLVQRITQSLNPSSFGVD